MRSLILIAIFISVSYSQQLLQAPTDLPSTDTYDLWFSKIVCDMDGDQSDDIFTVWVGSQIVNSNYKYYVAVYSQKTQAYMPSFEVDVGYEPKCNDHLSYGKLDSQNNYILFYGYIITKTSPLSKKKAL